MPALKSGEVVAIDGKTCRRSGKMGGHAVAFGQRVCRPGGLDSGTARDGREVKRENRHSRTVD